MKTCDVYRYLAMTIRENCAAVRYSDNGRRVDVSGAWGDCPTADDLATLKRCQSAIYRGWLAMCNGDADERRLERKSVEALRKAEKVVGAWGRSPAGGGCEIDPESVAGAGALVLVCHDAGGVTRRVDMSYYFGREG